MARAGEKWSGQQVKILRALAEGGSCLADIAVEMQRSRESVRLKARSIGIVIETQAKKQEGTERKCSNRDSEERPCRNTFVSKYAGPCQRCRTIPSATAFELPARLL